jgi:signal transduction histidine kinase
MSARLASLIYQVLDWFIPARLLGIAVRDTGVGIAPENLYQLFQNFAEAGR